MPSQGLDSRALQLQISASSELLIRNLKTADQAIDQFRRNVDRNLSTIDRGFSSVSRGFGGAIGKIRAEAAGALAVLGGFGFVGAARGFLEVADKAKQLDAQLKLATATFGSFGQAQTDVQAIAAGTRSGLEETAKLYGTFIRAAEQTGHTQEDAARASETFQRALKLGGASAGETSAAILQFSQALGSGVLRGDEFNSIAEASPRVLKLLSDALGVPSGQLRALAAQGKITSDVLFDALTNRKFTAGIDAEFGQLPETFGDAMTKVSNAALTAFGAFDRGGQFSQAIINFVDDGTTGFATLASRAEAFGVEVRADMAGLADVFDPLRTAGDGAFDRLGIRITSFHDQVVSVLQGVDELRNAFIDLNNLAARFDQKHLSGLPGYRVGQEQPRSDLAGNFERGYQQSRQGTQQRLAANNAAGATSRTPAARKSPAAPAKQAKAGRAARTPADPLANVDRDANKSIENVIRDRVDLDPAGQFRAMLDEINQVADGARARRDDETTERLSRPLEQYRQQLRDAAGDMSKAWEGVAANGLYAVENGLVDVISGTESVGHAFKRLAQSIISDLARIGIEKGILGLLGGATGGGGGILSSLLGGKRAAGGPVDRGSLYLVGERGPELFAPGASGNIIPNHALRSPSLGNLAGRGAGGGTFNVTVNAPGADPNSVRNAVMEGMRQAVRVSAEHTNDSLAAISRPRL